MYTIQVKMSKDNEIKLYREMIRIRVFEEKIKILCLNGVLPGPFHLYVGEEAIAVGVCSCLRKDDYITSTHRGHGHILAKGGEMKRAMAEVYGKESGYNKAKGGSLHIATAEVGILGATGIVGGGIPVATGAAFSSKYLENNKVVVAFFGDGAVSQGSFHEAINIAATFNLPIVYVCENNLYAVSTKQSTVRKIVDIADRAKAYDMPGVIVDGNDVEAVEKAANEAITRARHGDGPTLIECKTYRKYEHCLGDMTNICRPKEEIEKWMAPEKDPIARYAKKLIDINIITNSDLKKIEKEAELEVEEAVAFAESSPKAKPESALDDVYAV